MSESGNESNYDYADSDDDLRSYPSSASSSSREDEASPDQQPNNAPDADHDMIFLANESSPDPGNSDVQHPPSGNSNASSDDEEESSSEGNESDEEASSRDSAEENDDFGGYEDYQESEDDGKGESSFEDDKSVGPAQEAIRDFVDTMLNSETGLSSLIKVNQILITTNNVPVNFNDRILLVEFRNETLSHFFCNVDGNEMKIHLHTKSSSTDTSATASNRWIGISCPDESMIEDIEVTMENGTLSITLPK